MPGNVTQRNDLIFLLAGGDESTQKTDIARAKALAQQLAPKRKKPLGGFSKTGCRLLPVAPRHPAAGADDNHLIGV